MSVTRFWPIGDDDDVEWRIISVRSKSDRALSTGDIVRVNQRGGDTARVRLGQLDLDASCITTDVELWHFMRLSDREQ